MTVTPLTQPDIFELTSFLSTEMLVLQLAMATCAQELEGSRSRHDLPRMQAALTRIETLHDQASLLNDSMRKAINKEIQRRGIAG